MTTGLPGVYFDAWNDADPAGRLRKLEEVWSPDGILIDPFDERPAVGPAEISETIAKAFRERIPTGHRFVIASAVEQQHQSFRYRWALADGTGRPLREGIDTGRLAPDGRLALILTFLGLLPPMEPRLAPSS